MSEESWRPPYDPVAWRDGEIRLLDQTALPDELRYVDLTTLEEVIEAIASMRVRGAPAIGVAAAYGVALAARCAAERAGDVLEATRAAARSLAATRPTAVNLAWAAQRVVGAVERAGPAAVADAAVAALAEALAIHEEQIVADRAIARHGAALLQPGSRVSTHCNTGPLATAGLGTALGVLIEGHRSGRVAAVLVDETRPRLQGARLTAWELERFGVPHEVIADGAAATLMAAGAVDAAVVGADRIAANGDTANKIGTYALAIAARYHDIPFYVAAPVSTIDRAMPDGRSIPIEERDGGEVREPGGHPLMSATAPVRNPAFDVTPAALITAIITERGVLEPPFPESIVRALA